MKRKTMLITGGSRGIGASIAKLASKRAYDVIFCYAKDSVSAKSLVDQINASGGRAHTFQADVSREDDVLRLFDKVDERFGRLDALVNNAGILDVQMRLEDMSAKRIERVFSTNVLGAFLCAREAVKRMSLRRGGSGGGIVNLSSRAARLGSPGEYVDYAASKAAVETMTIGLAKEVAGEGIRVNAVAPGIIDTEIHASGGDPGRVARLRDSIPMLREGTAEEVARAVLWLLSEEASYTTAAILDVGGGR